MRSRCSTPRTAASLRIVARQATWSMSRGGCQSSYDHDGKIRDRVNLISADFGLLAKATALSRTGVGEKEGGSLCPRLSRLGATAAPPLPAALPTQGRLLKRCNVMTTYRTTLHPCTFNVGTVWDSTHPSPGIAPRRCVARHFIRSRAVLVGAAAVGFVPLRFLRDRQRCAVR